MPRAEIAEMTRAVSPVRRRIRAPHILRQNISRLESAHQQRSDVAHHRRDPIAGFERVGRADRNRLLPQAAIQTAHHLILPHKKFEPLFKGAVQAHEVVELQLLLARERKFHFYRVEREILQATTGASTEASNSKRCCLISETPASR